MAVNLEATVHTRSMTCLAGLVVFLVAGCEDSDDIAPVDPPPRPIKSFVISEEASSIRRTFPSVLEPRESSELSFETGGQVGPIDLRVGQNVRKGDVLASIDSRSLMLELDRAKNSVEQAEARLRNARGTFDRQEQLLEDGFTTRAAHEEAETALRTAEAELDSARAQEALAAEALSKADLIAPFDGTIARIGITAFDVVAAGTPVISIYDSTQFEVPITVPATIVNSVAEGQAASVRIAQRPELELAATLTEVGARADDSGAFPAIATLTNPAVGLKSGMAAEVIVDIPVAGLEPGFLVPVSALAIDGLPSGVQPPADTERQAQVYRYDPESETVVIRPVTIAGVRGNSAIVTGGLAPGDRIASAGVSFLHDGQAVTLLPND